MIGLVCMIAVVSIFVMPWVVAIGAMVMAYIEGRPEKKK